MKHTLDGIDETVSTRLLSHLPIGLVVFRFVAGPVLWWDAWHGRVSRPFWPILFSLAVLSDVLDGWVARRYGVDTQWLREADSRVDTCLYVFVGLSMWCAYPETLARWTFPLSAMAASHLLQWGTALFKFGKLASYHSVTAKLWGVSLGVATGFLFAFSFEPFLWGPAVLGIVDNIHEIYMTCVLSEWTHDVWDIRAAWKLEKVRQVRLAKEA